jgi:UDP:flavonoid glycosyltransferase YjiC (YdhE family)
VRFAIAVHGTRGDIEPATAVGRELIRRGHVVTMAVPPNLVSFTEAAGIPGAVAYGPDSQQQLEAEIFKKWYQVRNPLTILRQAREYVVDGWADMSTTLAELASDADLVLTGTTYQEVAANVAEAAAVPMAALHYFPARPSTHGLPFALPFELPGKLAYPVFAAAEWGHWRLLKPAEDEQRRGLGLPAAHVRASRRIVDSGALEIQAYDKVFFPGLQEEWGSERPLVGSITLQMPTSADADVMSWIDAGTPPVYFGFGSMPVSNPAEALAMIERVSRRLGQRALVCSGVLAVDADGPGSPEMLVVRSVNHAEVFPRCRAIVHHGGSGTTAASVRSGAPTLILWVGADQPVWAGRVKRLGVGTARRFSASTEETMLGDLRTTLGPDCSTRAREVAAEMTPPDRSLATTADLLEHAAGRGNNRPSARR